MTESDYYYSKGSQDRIYGDLQHESAMAYLITREQMVLFEILKPKLYKDGQQWCVLYGENIQEGVSGFGKSPNEAIINFNKSFYQPIN
jgi:hypothetical protein